MDKIAVIVPAYNEEKSIEAVVQSINIASKESPIPLQAVVVNDGSKDKTKEIINRLDCVALNLPINLGIGGAVQCGYKYALENKFSYAVQVDGDGQHPPKEIKRLYEHMIKENLDVCIGSRFIENKGFQSTFIRRVGINYFKWLNKLLTGWTITDNTSGLRLINKDALKVVNNYYPDDYPEPEAIILFYKNGLRVGELAVLMEERQGGESSIGPFASVYYMIKVSLAIFFTFIKGNNIKVLNR